MVARDGHRPGLVTVVKAHQELRRVVDIALRVEHLPDAVEVLAMVMMIDLHAAEIDQDLALPTGRLEGCNGGLRTSRKDGFSLYVQCVGLEAALVAGLRQADRVKDADGYAVAICGAQDFGLAGVRGARRIYNRKARYTQCRCRDRPRDPEKFRGGGRRSHCRFLSAGRLAGCRRNSPRLIRCGCRL